MVDMYAKIRWIFHFAPQILKHRDYIERSFRGDKQPCCARTYASREKVGGRFVPHNWAASRPSACLGAGKASPMNAPAGSVGETLRYMVVV
jgi:hypothetical protein